MTTADLVGAAAVLPDPAAGPEVLLLLPHPASAMAPARATDTTTLLRFMEAPCFLL
jgi:hypothetical protein